MLKWLVVLAGIGFLGYSYVMQPLWVELGLQHAACKVRGGEYLRSTELAPSYRKMMNETPENASRLQDGDAAGCFADGACVFDRQEAVGKLERKMLDWGMSGGGNLLKGNVFKMLGMDNEALARARQVEAEFCVRYLGDVRKELLRGVN